MFITVIRLLFDCTKWKTEIVLVRVANPIFANSLPLHPLLVEIQRSKVIPLYTVPYMDSLDQCDQFIYFYLSLLAPTKCHIKVCYRKKERKRGWLCCTLKHKQTHLSGPSFHRPPLCLCQTEGALLCPPPILARCDPDDGSFQR